MKILERVAKTSAQGLTLAQFRPTTQREYVALQLARRFSDLSAVRHYAEIAPRYGIGQLLRAYSQTIKAKAGTDLRERFHVELERAGDQSGTRFSKQRLIAIRIERRAVAVSVTTGKQLEHVQLRELSSDPGKAITSAVGFVADVIGRFPLRSAALEIIPGKNEVQRSHLYQAIKRLLLEQSVSLWEVSKQQLLEAFGHPPLRFRKDLRTVVTAIWPQLAGGQSMALIQDAEALAIYCQTERHFINDEQYV
jgi:hypothetical protein